MEYRDKFTELCAAHEEELADERARRQAVEQVVVFMCGGRNPQKKKVIESASMWGEHAMAESLLPFLVHTPKNRSVLMDAGAMYHNPAFL